MYSVFQKWLHYRFVQRNYDSCSLIFSFFEGGRGEIAGQMVRHIKGHIWSKLAPPHFKCHEGMFPIIHLSVNYDPHRHSSSVHKISSPICCACYSNLRMCLGGRKLFLCLHTVMLMAGGREETAHRSNLLLCFLRSVRRQMRWRNTSTILLPVPALSEREKEEGFNFVQVWKEHLQVALWTELEGRRGDIPEHL